MKLVLDEFYKDPDALRELALELEYTSRARNFPGRRSTRTLIPKDAQAAFSRLLGVKLVQSAIPYNGCFQLMRKQDWKDAYVHADHGASWAGLVYLSPQASRTSPAAANGGTSFFRHRLTGLQRLPSTEESGSVAADFGLRGEELLLLLKSDRKQRRKWEEIDRVGYLYNRFVLYDARLFHCNGKPWGSGLRDGRLTHNFFAS